jgi:hypothetical protein
LNTIAAGKRPVERAHSQGAREPDREAGGEARHEGRGVREMHEHQAHQDCGGIHRQARKRALRDEGVVVVEREEM